MTIARLRRIALWLQSRLIDANYDTELTGEGLTFERQVLMKLTYRSPKLFKHGGVWLRLWGKWYRVYAVKDKRLS